MPAAMRENLKKVDAVHRKRLLLCIERMLGERTLEHKDESYIKESLAFLKSPSVDCDVSFQNPAFQHRVYKCEKKLEDCEVVDQLHNKTDEGFIPYLPHVGQVATSALPQPMIVTKTQPAQEEDTTSVEKLQLLMQEKKEIHERELQLEQAKKKGLLNEIVELTGALKESTLGISRTVKDQTQVCLYAYRFAFPLVIRVTMLCPLHHAVEARPHEALCRAE